MIEVTVLNYLKTRTNLPVYLEIPKDAPQSFYKIEKTGSSLDNHIYSSTFAIQSYSDSMYNAAVMNEDLKGYMLDGLIECSEIASVGLNSDYNYTDTTTKRYRYQAVFDIVHY